MANFPKMKLTNAGLELLANVQAGADSLIFTKTVLGDGEVSTPIVNLKSLVSPKIEIAITEGKQVGTSTYQIGAFFSNAEITTGFWWREIGVFAKGNDGNEILYCYSNAGDAGDYIPVGSDERVEKYIYQSLAIGNAENVTAEIDETDSFILKTEKGKAGGIAPLGEDGKVRTEYLPKMDYASNAEVVQIKSDLSAHLTTTNPHNITAATVGLEKVPNVATNDQTPTYTEASTLTNLTSGEKLGIALGKIKKAITDLISHLADTTKHITSTERTTWNGKAPNSHASTATTYGVGTESNYGHLKITDSKTSTAAGTAASAKALKEVNEIADGANYKLLKTQNVSVSATSALGGNFVGEATITGVDFTKFREYEIVLDGTLYMNSAGAQAGTVFSIWLGDSAKETKIFTHNFGTYAAGERTQNICIRKVVKYGNVYYGTVTNSSGVVTGTEIFNYITNDTSNNVLYPNAPNRFRFEKSYQSYTFTFTGNIYVYGRGAI